jgi:hypothetical protein
LSELFQGKKAAYERWGSARASHLSLQFSRLLNAHVHEVEALESLLLDIMQIKMVPP